MQVRTQVCSLTHSQIRWRAENVSNFFNLHSSEWWKTDVITENSVAWEDPIPSETPSSREQVCFEKVKIGTCTWNHLDSIRKSLKTQRPNMMTETQKAHRNLLVKVHQGKPTSCFAETSRTEVVWREIRAITGMCQKVQNSKLQIDAKSETSVHTNTQQNLLMIREIHHRLRFTFHLMTNDRCNYENFSRWKRQGTETMNLTILQLWEEHLKSPVAALTQAPDCQNDAYDCWSGSQSTGPSHWGPLVASLSSGMAAKVVGAKMLQDSQRLECSGEVRAAWRNLFLPHQEGAFRSYEGRRHWCQRCGQHSERKSIWTTQSHSVIKCILGVLSEQHKSITQLWWKNRNCSRSWSAQAQISNRREKSQRFTAWSFAMEGHAQECVDRHCECAPKTVDQFQKVSTPNLDDHQIKPEDLEVVGELLETCS